MPAAELQPGLVGEAHLVVSQSQLASAVGSGSIDVFATPAMIALMEQAAVNCVSPSLAAGTTTVGTRIDVQHLAPTPPGATVTARAELLAVAERRLTFRVSAHDGTETIGEGTHERAIVNPERLLARAHSKVAH